MKQQLVEQGQKVVDSDALRICLGAGVTWFCYLENAATVMQQLGLIIGPILVVASLIHVILKVSKQIRGDDDND